jgi:hypothetical protein
MPTRTRIRGLYERTAARIYLAAAVTVLAAAAWLRADAPVDDRGSDSTEKAQNIILAMTISGIVGAGAIALVTKLKGLW